MLKVDVRWERWDDDFLLLVDCTLPLNNEEVKT